MGFIQRKLKEKKGWGWGWRKVQGLSGERAREGQGNKVLLLVFVEYTALLILTVESFVRFK